jgi:UDP-N-acetyl-D-galactosamine dehydrogenase
MGINTFDVLEAAGTKWNFLRFFPGLVGGHCIGVDPYYLTFKAKELKYHPQVIDSGRFVNDSMGPYIAKQLVKKLIAAGKNVRDCRILIMGTTFKENVSDIRNSKVDDVYNELISYGLHIDVVDPHASSKEVKHEYGYDLAEAPSGKYDAVIVAVSHNDYLNMKESDFLDLMDDKGVLVDVKGLYRKHIKSLTYWSL